mgnify:CR=1 FL=1
MRKSVKISLTVVALVALLAAAVTAGVSEMYSPDENLESVFKYLVAR